MITLRPTRTWLGITGLLIVSIAFTVMHGGLGLVLAGLIAVSWRVLPPMYAFVLGHFALIFVLSDASGLAVVATSELGLITMLLTATTGPPYSKQVFILSICAMATTIVLAWLSLHQLATVWGVGSFVLGGGAILAYWIHRYERVVLEQPADTPPNNE